MFNYASYITTWCQKKNRILFEDRTVIFDKHFVERTFCKRFWLFFFDVNCRPTWKKADNICFTKYCVHISVGGDGLSQDTRQNEFP